MPLNPLFKEGEKTTQKKSASGDEAPLPAAAAAAVSTGDPPTDDFRVARQTCAAWLARNANWPRLRLRALTYYRRARAAVRRVPRRLRLLLLLLALALLVTAYVVHIGVLSRTFGRFGGTVSPRLQPLDVERRLSAAAAASSSSSSSNNAAAGAAASATAAGAVRQPYFDRLGIAYARARRANNNAALPRGGAARVDTDAIAFAERLAADATRMLAQPLARSDAELRAQNEALRGALNASLRADRLVASAEAARAAAAAADAAAARAELAAVLQRHTDAASARVSVLEAQLAETRAALRERRDAPLSPDRLPPSPPSSSSSLLLSSSPPPPSPPLQHVRPMPAGTVVYGEWRDDGSAAAADAFRGAMRGAPAAARAVVARIAAASGRPPLQWTRARLRKCLRDRWILLLGDETQRALYNALLDVMGVDASYAFDERRDVPACALVGDGDGGGGNQSSANEPVCMDRARCACYERRAEADYIDRWHRFRLSFAWKESAFDAALDQARFDGGAWLRTFNGTRRSASTRTVLQWPRAAAAAPWLVVVNVGLHALHQATTSADAAFRGAAAGDADDAAHARFATQLGALTRLAQRSVLRDARRCAVWRATPPVDERAARGRLAAAPFAALSRVAVDATRAAGWHVLDAATHVVSASSDGVQRPRVAPLEARLLLSAACALCDARDDNDDDDDDSGSGGSGNGTGDEPTQSTA